MGIRFRCHHCERELHVKDFQAGKRGRCPECGGRFRVPLEDAPHSLDPQNEFPEPETSVSQAEHAAKSAKAVDARTEKATSAPATSGEPASASADVAAAAASPSPVSPSAASSSAASASPMPPSPPPVLPRALQIAAEGKWYVRPPSGGQYGPAATSTMSQWLVENRVGRDSLVWTEGWPEWIVAENAFDDFFQASTPTVAPDIPPPQSAAAHELPVNPAVPGLPAVAPVTPADPLLGDRNRAERKQKKRRNYTLMIVGLALVMLVLIGTLIYVLGSQAS